MILEPKQVWAIDREVRGTVKVERDHHKLQDFFDKYRLNTINELAVPRYWSAIVLEGLKLMVEEFPNLKFTSIFEYNCGLVVNTVPTASNILDGIKVELYNQIDDLILETVEELSKQEPLPYCLKRY